MEYRKFEHTFVVRLDPGDEILTSLIKLCRDEKIGLASVTGLGAVGTVQLGVFDTEKKQYYSREYKGLYEIASLMGSITKKEGDPYLHLHMVIGNPQTGECHGGHLGRAVISATGELVLTEIPGAVGRREDEAIGLNLFQFDAEA
ncbi:PPC domain-containing DNA-binding protein [Clostridium sp. Marseille-P2415]|uniref:PPC domain-containing DNA-binding protein n=1 Tax=Clostridium sp. Marseille-P2415 TaxID=1805471 RepID=UPI0009888648|nr:PPC domain-containing DNA-binding protein [Clostridium sp. Marseille-P2415]